MTINLDVKDRVILAVLERLTIKNSRLTDIISSELLRVTGSITPDRIGEVREALLRKVGIEDNI